MNIQVQGGQILSGEITPSGSKNSAVALIPASLLFDKQVEFENVPEITDVERLVKILAKLGSRIEWNRETKLMKLDNSSIRFEDLDQEDLGNMKGTSLLWGPMLARFKKVNFEDLPGGCTLGARPLGPQFDAFRELGVVVEDSNNSAKMDATNAKANSVWLPEMSPTATENIIMLAVSLPGKTTIIGAASEPQVQDLCQFLTQAGAKIDGVGSSVLEIEGTNIEDLNPQAHKIWPDHYEIATFLAMAAITGGELKVNGTKPAIMGHINYIFSKFNVQVNYSGEVAHVAADQNIKIKSEGPGPLIVRAQPWPSLPVDLLPIFIPLALASEDGLALFHNWMYESGLFWTSELTKLGANIIMADPHRVIVGAGCKLKGAELEAPYIIRAVVAMVMCAMMAEGESTILNADALYRGHPHFSENLQKLGITIVEIK